MCLVFRGLQKPDKCFSCGMTRLWLPMAVETMVKRWWLKILSVLVKLRARVLLCFFLSSMRLAEMLEKEHMPSYKLFKVNSN